MLSRIILLTGQSWRLFLKNSRIIRFNLFRRTAPPALRETDKPNCVSVFVSDIKKVRLRPTNFRESRPLTSRKKFDLPVSLADRGNLRPVSDTPTKPQSPINVRQKPLVSYDPWRDEPL
jgi:hypothetical protein